MGKTISVAHDFTCPWCWIGMFQARRLRLEFGSHIDWRPYELYPEGTPLPDGPPEIPTLPNRPPTPTRLELALAGHGLDPIERTLAYRVRTRLAHAMVEFAKVVQVEHELVERLYFAHWKGGQDISDIQVLLELAKGLIPNLDQARSAIRDGRFDDRIIAFSKPAHASGVYNLPTFFVDGERFAEQPYAVLAETMQQPNEEAPYSFLEFPSAPEARPYVCINMVSTIDGKTVSGSREDTVMDLGSKVDHRAMRNIEQAVEAVMIGAQTLRATPQVRFDPKLFRIVVSRKGDVDTSVRFFTEAPQKAIVATSQAADIEGAIHWHFESLPALLKSVREELGVTRLLVEGGSELNASLLREDLVDELFLTVAPKIRLGRELPTYAGGEPLPKGQLMNFELLSNTRIGDELFLRYRRKTS